jgi:DNA-binding MarR family transcriptional regulator
MSGGLAKRIGKRLPFESPEQEAYLNLVHTTSVLSEAFDRLFKKHGLSPSTYNVLRILRGEQPAGVAILEIRRRMVSRVPDVTRLVNRLEENGLVRRCQCPKDRRVVYTHITEAGLAKLAKLDDLTIALHRTQFSHLAPEKVVTLSRLLEEARDPFDAEGTPIPPCPE